MQVGECEARKKDKHYLTRICRDDLSPCVDGEIGRQTDVSTLILDTYILNPLLLQQNKLFVCTFQRIQQAVSF